MSCKRRLFKKLLFLSIAFCCVSVVYNGIIHAELSRKKQKAKNHVVHVKVQQQKFEQYAQTLPEQQAAEIRQKREQSLAEQSKPLIDGNQMFGAIQNELKYIGGQVRFGRVPYNIGEAFGMIRKAF